MSFPPTIIAKPARWFSDRHDQKIQCIVAHDTERGSDNSNSINYLQRGGDLPDGSDRKVSIHALIEPNGDIYEMVADHYAANHAGFSKLTINGVTYSQQDEHGVNQISLGFELEYTKAPYKGAYPPEQLLSMGWWVATKRAKYGKLPLYRHAQIDTHGKTDTRNLTVEQIELWVTRAEMLMQSVPTPSTPVKYRMRVPQVVYTSRSLSSAFAGDHDTPLVIDQNIDVMIGDVTGDWLWLVNGWGFIPVNTAIRI